MLTKHNRDHRVVRSPFCGEIREILAGSEYQPNVAGAIDISPTAGHYHRDFDEVYFVLDGELTLQLHDPSKEKTWTERLLANELCVVSKGTHHRITEASSKNRLCVISVPQFNPEDEHVSPIVNQDI